MRMLLAALALAVPGVHHTTAGMHAARGALLRPADLGAPWVVGKTPKKVGSLSCTGGVSSVKGVVETGAAVTGTFRAGPAGPFVSQSVFVYRSAAAARRYFRRAARPNLARCLEQMLTGGNTNQSVAFTPGKQQVLPMPRVPADTAARRIVGQAVATDQKLRIYVDVIVLQRGAAISEIAASSFSQPFRAATERAIVRAATRRLQHL